MALSVPMLLNLSPATLAAKCRALTALPGLPPGAAAGVALQVPGVLLLAAPKLARRWEFIRAAAGARGGGGGGEVGAAPGRRVRAAAWWGGEAPPEASHVGAPPAPRGGRATGWTAPVNEPPRRRSPTPPSPLAPTLHAAAACPRWRGELPGLSPASLGSLLGSSDRRLGRLRYLYSSGGSGGVPLYTAVTMGQAPFEARFRGYAAWEAAGGGGGGAAGEGPEAAAAAAAEPSGEGA
jgi:hypothetical protein